MGEVIGSAIVLLAVVVMVGGGLAVVLHLVRHDPHAVESPRFRNHQAMARWIDAVLRTPGVAGEISSEDADRARHLLAEFYGERPMRGER